MMAHHQMQQQQPYYHQHQYPQHGQFPPQMPKGSLDVLAAASSPSKRHKLE